MSFLADTGADLTSIMPADWQRFSVPIEQLANSFDIYGVGGKAEGFLEPAIITFLEPGIALRTYTTNVVILKPTQYIMDCASLLGRDILQNWAFSCDKTLNKVEAKVRKADHTFKLTKEVPGHTPLLGVTPSRVWP